MTARRPGSWLRLQRVGLPDDAGTGPGRDAADRAAAHHARRRDLIVRDRHVPKPARRRQRRQHHPDWWTDLDTKAVDTARLLAADAVQKVGNGHPGTAMSLAPLAYLLYQRVMRHDPTDPNWIGRDRFVLSNGHSSLTQYCQLFLSGYGLELDDLEALRTWGSLTPGHPEHGHTAGVEITTGPLGQGVANAVGMAMAARRERGLFDPDAAPGESPVRPPHLRDRRRRLTWRRASPARRPRSPATSSSAT